MSRQLQQRNDQIYDLATKAGRSTADLATEFGVTRPRIYQIVRSVGLRRHGASFTLE